MTARFALFGLTGLFWLVVGPLPAAGQTAPTALSTTQAKASTTVWHAVEVLVFRDVSSGNVQGETWPATAPAPSFAHAVYPGGIANGPYASLSRKGALIANATLRLQRSPHYAIIQTLGWQQPAATSRLVSFTPIPTARSSASAFHPAVTGDNNARSTTHLTGTARLLSAGRRTYVTLHLRLCEPAPSGIIVQTPLGATEGAAASRSMSAPATATASLSGQSIVPDEQCFALDQHHKVESGKLAYFDNPVLGALVSVRSIKPPKKSITEK
jgi:hypothetical protein